MLRIFKQCPHVIRKVDQDFLDFAPLRDIRKATAVLEFCDKLGITRIAIPDMENATVCRQEPDLTRESIDIVGTEHVSKQLFGKRILGRILLVAKRQVATAHEREFSMRTRREFQDLDAILCNR